MNSDHHLRGFCEFNNAVDKITTITSGNHSMIHNYNIQLVTTTYNTLAQERQTERQNALKTMTK